MTPFFLKDFRISLTPYNFFYQTKNKTKKSPSSKFFVCLLDPSKKSSKKFWYWCNYLHWPRDSVSPVCRIFLKLLRPVFPSWRLWWTHFTSRQANKIEELTCYEGKIKKCEFLFCLRKTYIPKNPPTSKSPWVLHLDQY